jgi:phosphoglycolate phosphatase
MKEYDLYIFDFDMTLFDTMKGVRKAYKKAFEAADLPFDENKCQMYIRESIDQTFHRYSDAPCRYREFVAGYINESVRSMADNTVIFPETADVILTLKRRGKDLCIASGKTEERIKQILSQHQLLSCFDHIFGFERMAEPKPSPYCLNWIIGQYDIPKERICYVGDAERDMMAADAAGIDGIFVPRFYDADVHCAFEIKNLREILEY